jgi:hypothetical protein
MNFIQLKYHISGHWANDHEYGNHKSYGRLEE